jgi:hypothetical protein
MHVQHPSDLSRLNRVAAYYLMATTFYTVIWAARLSILFSIIRIDPSLVIRRRLKWLAAAFLAALCALLFQFFWTCEHSHAWKSDPSPQCPLPKQVAICQLISTYVSASYVTLLYSRRLPQPTFWPIWPSSFCPSVSSAALRTSACAGALSPSSPRPVSTSIGLLVRTNKQNFDSCDNDRVPRARSVHHQQERHTRGHRRARRGLHVAHRREPTRRRDRLLPPPRERLAQ